MTKTNCIAEDLLSKASVIEVNGYLLHNWLLEYLDDMEDDDTVFSFVYHDEEHLIYDFEFTKKEFKNAKLKEHLLTMVDVNRETVEIGLYSITPLKY